MKLGSDLATLKRAFPNASLVEYFSLGLYFIIGGIFFNSIFSECLFSGFFTSNLGILNSGISFNACFNSALERAFPCHPSWFSKNETPFPLTVFRIIATGFPKSSIIVNISCNAETSCPSTTAQAHPAAVSLSLYDS